MRRLFIFNVIGYGFDVCALAVTKEKAFIDIQKNTGIQEKLKYLKCVEMKGIE